MKRCLTVLAALAACLFLSPAARAETVRDAHGRSVEVTDTSRIVSIGGSVTEILHALSRSDSIVGRDSTSLYPPAALSAPDVGYMRALSAEGVLSLSPTLILSVDGAGPPDVIALLEGAGIPFVNIPDVPTAEGVAAKIEAVAQAVGEMERGAELAEAVRADFQALEQALAGVETRPRAAFVLSMSGGAPLVAGAGSSADSALALAGATNVFAGLKGFRPATPEAVLAAAPQVIVSMRSAAHDPASLAQSPVFAQTPAGREGRIVAMDGGYLLGFGPRAPQAMRELAQALHPGLALPSLPDRPWAAGTDG